MMPLPTALTQQMEDAVIRAWRSAKVHAHCARLV